MTMIASLNLWSAPPKSKLALPPAAKYLVHRSASCSCSFDGTFSAQVHCEFASSSDLGTSLIV